MGAVPSIIGHPMIVYENSNTSLQWTITDSAGNPVNLTGHTLHFILFTNTLSVVTTVQTISTGITIGGAGNNIVTLALTTTETASVFVGYYNLFDVTSGVVLATDGFEIQPAGV